LADIRELLSLRTDEAVGRAGMRARIERHLNEVDRRMVALRAMAATLERLLDLLDRDRRSDDCPILESLEQTTTRG
jgi:hypothetical protein